MEHSPRPGVTWATELVRVERVVEDDAPEPRPNRAARRAAARAAQRTNTSMEVDHDLSVLRAGDRR